MSKEKKKTITKQLIQADFRELKRLDQKISVVRRRILNRILGL